MEHRISRAWEQYKLDRMPPGASIYQQQELRRAFYAGAKAMIEAVRDADGRSETTMCAYIEIAAVLFDAEAECKLFAKQTRTVRR